GAAKAVTLTMPELKGRIDGMAFRVPTATVSVCDFVATTSKSVSREEVNEAFRDAASESLRGILGYIDEPLVSSDFKGDPRSSIFDSLSTMVLDGNLVKVLSWYDNEWGYSCRVADLCALISDRGI
ncbi:MAG: type I glyceraldehyde-3-phosphate dehydrogenase, partial [Chloroflexota bacterium]